ncbi:MAG: 2-amino-4-hydroxy-6-hydroxymethyldihydropteridine diphosphokinase [Actinomycetota bacterium]
MTPASRAYLGLGANLGDRLASLRLAVALLEERGARFLRSSRVYETEPVGPPQPDYLNVVIEVETELSARGLLIAGLAVEQAMGRVREERWGPRLIDVDILTFGEQEVDEPDLQVPHPRMHERAFVMIPLLELDADPMLPRGRKATALRMGAWSIGGVRPFAPPLERASSGA